MLQADLDSLQSVNGFFLELLSICTVKRRFLFRAATVFCYYNFSSTGDRVVFHQRLSSARDSLSESSCHGCLEKKMEKTPYSGDGNFRDISILA